MAWAAHGGSSAFVVLILVTFMVRALAGRGQPGAGRTPGFRAWPGPPGPRRTAGGTGTAVPGDGDWDATAGPGNAHTGIPPGWLPDPTGRYQQRYWSGRAWTEHVTSSGVPGTDPPPPTGGTGRPDGTAGADPSAGAGTGG